MRVLLIEDDSATAQSIELMLKSEGFNVYTTDLGEEGIDLGKIYDYDIILLDLNLPDMSGFDPMTTDRGGHRANNDNGNSAVGRDRSCASASAQTTPPPPAITRTILAAPK